MEGTLSSSKALFNSCGFSNDPGTWPRRSAKPCHFQVRLHRYVGVTPKKSAGFPTSREAEIICRAQKDYQNAAAAELFTEDPSPAKRLRKILASPGLHLGPACHDALSAKLVQNAGFSFTFMSGFGVSASRLACPDTGLISYGEMVDQGRNTTAAVSIPVIGDGDTGYGNALNVKRTVKGYIQAGFAGILLEDQVLPKACGHTKGRKVVSREEAVARVKAAADARDESGRDIVIVARTDARQAVSLEEAFWRSDSFANAGADVLFIDALMSKEEMRKFVEIAPSVPKMANMLEGGGRTPFVSPVELDELGYKIVDYPLSLLGVSIRAMQDALVALRSGRLPSKMPSFDEVKEIVGFNSYYKEENRYAVASRIAEAASVYAKVNTPGVSSEKEEAEESGPSLTPEVLDEESSDCAKKSSSLLGIWSRVLRVKITGNNGIVKLDIRIPAGFLDNLAKTIPGVAGINVKDVLENASASPSSGQHLLDIVDKQGDRIQILFE